MLAAWLACLVLAGCQPSPAGPCQLALAAVIPFTRRSQHIAIQALVNGRAVSMIVDTGASATMLTTAAADRLALRLEALPRFIDGIGGRQQAFGFVARSFQIGRLHGRNFALAAADLGSARQARFEDGLFGADFLAAYDLDVDVPDGRVVLYRASGGCSNPSAALDGNLYVVPLLASHVGDSRPHVRVQIGGKTLTALVDTGAPRSVLFRDPARRIGLDMAALNTDQHVRAGGVGPATPDAVRHVLAPVTIGELVVTHLPVTIIDQRAPEDADMLLGMDFLSRVHAWFSFSSQNLVLQYPPVASAHGW